MTEVVLESVADSQGGARVIQLFSQKDEQRWDAFVEAHTEGTFFHLAPWRHVIEKAFGHKTYFLFVEENGEIQGVLPLGHVNSRLFGNTLVSTPFCVYGGMLVNNFEARLALDNAAQKLAQQLKVDCLELRNRKQEHTSWPSKSDLYVTFRKDIDPDPEVNMQNIPRKQRAMVRKGIKAGLVGEIDFGLDRFYEAYASSVHALGTPVFSRKYFEVLKNTFGDKCEILVITKDGELISAVMSFYYKDEVLPYYGGGTSAARRVKGNDFMYWELMRRAGENGIRVFDYGRSKVGTGSYSFKKNWGFEPVPLHYEYYLVNATEIPDINPLNPKYRLFIAMWKKLPFALTKLIGPHIVKNLG